MSDEYKFDPHDLANEELHHVYRGNARGLISTALAGVVVAGVLSWKAQVYAGLLWFGWLCIASGWHWMIGHRFNAGLASGLGLSNIHHHMIAAASAGLGWGALVIALPYVDRLGQDLLLVLLLASLNTMLPRLVVFLPIFLAYAAAIYLPLLLIVPFVAPDSRKLLVIVVFATALMQWLGAREVRRKLVETLLKQLAFERASWEDKLTGLGNRRRFEERLDASWHQALRMKVPLSLIILDVDHFKRYNDTYGHTEGDNCLQRVAAALDNCVKRGNDTVVRYGGEEFVAILFHANVHDAKNIGEHIRAAVEALRLTHEQSPHQVVTVSVGGATIIPSTDATPKELLNKADGALYQAKSAGRNRVEWAAVT